MFSIIDYTRVINMRSFISMYRQAFDFHGKTTVGEFVCAVLLFWIVGTFLTLGVSTILGEEIGIIFMIGYYIISFIPFVAMVVRRVRDTDRGMANLLWIFVPILGWAVFVILLLSRSRAQRDRDFDRYHW